MAKWLLEFPSDTTSLQAVVDPENLIPESDENNNTARFARPLPDLAIEARTQEFQDAEMEVIVKNIGATATGAPSRSPLELGFEWYNQEENIIGWGAPLYSYGAELGEGESFTVMPKEHEDLKQWFLNPPKDAIGAMAIVDPDSHILEEAEDNNTIRMSRSLPDLVIESPTISQGEGLLAFTVWNRGHGVVPATSQELPITVKLTWLTNTDEEVGRDEMILLEKALLSAGSISYRTLPQSDDALWLMNAPEGAAKLLLMIDPENTIIEMKEDNNAFIFARELPDLIIDSLVFDPSKHVVSFQIRNNGDPLRFSRGGPTMLLDTSFTLLNKEGDIVDSPIIVSHHIPPLTEREQYSYTSANDEQVTEWIRQFVSLAHMLKVTLDPKNVVHEGREQNNAYEMFVDNEVTGEALALLDETVIAMGLSTKIPRILPGNPLYVLKRFWRGVQGVFSFTPQQELALRLSFVNEKIVEADALRAKKRFNPLPKHLKSYQDELDRIQALLVELRVMEPESTELAIQRHLQELVQHQILFGKIMRASPEQLVQDIAERRNAALVHMENILLHFPQEHNVEAVLLFAMGNRGSAFRGMRTLEVVKALEEHTADEMLTKTLQQLTKHLLDRFRLRFESLAARDQKLFIEYMQHVGGDKERYLSLIKTILTNELKAETKQILREAAQHL
jgi:hypothetical protein